jgi:hypothetical protein
VVQEVLSFLNEMGTHLFEENNNITSFIADGLANNYVPGSSCCTRNPCGTQCFACRNQAFMKMRHHCPVYHNEFKIAGGIQDQIKMIEKEFNTKVNNIPSITAVNILEAVSTFTEARAELIKSIETLYNSLDVCHACSMVIVRALMTGVFHPICSRMLKRLFSVHSQLSDTQTVRACQCRLQRDFFTWKDTPEFAAAAAKFPSMRPVTARKPMETVETEEPMLVTDCEPLKQLEDMAFVAEMEDDCESEDDFEYYANTGCIGVVIEECQPKATSHKRKTTQSLERSGGMSRRQPLLRLIDGHRAGRGVGESVRKSQPGQRLGLA